MYLLVEFIYIAFTCMPGGVTVDDSGLCCCFPCLLSAVNSLCVISGCFCEGFAAAASAAGDESPLPGHHRSVDFCWSAL